MFFCSKEEPVINNESLYQQKGSNGNLIIDQSAGLLINRYGFVYKGSEIDKDIPILIKSLINHLGIKVFIVLCWLEHIPGKSKVAAKVIKKRYENKNWSIHTRSDHYVAIKGLSSNDINAWPPIGINPIDGGIVLMFGEYDEIDILDSISDNNSMFLARNKYFVPDIDFMSNLEKKKKMALYQINDELNNIGLVLTGDGHVSMKTISEKNNINSMFNGESSYKIFV